MHRKQAGGPVDWLVSAAKAFANASIWAQAAITTGMIGTGAGIGYGAAKMLSPSPIVKNSDKELELEAINTEIDVTKRRIAKLETQRANAQVAKPKVYDRFV